MSTAEIILAMSGDAELSGPALTVGIMIYAYIDVTGQSPSIARLMQLCRTDQRNVYRYVKELVSRGWINKETVPGIGSQYALPDERVAAIEAYIRELRTPGANTRGQSATPGSVTRGAPGSVTRGPASTPGADTRGSRPPISSIYNIYNNSSYKGENPLARAEVEPEQNPLPSGTPCEAPPPVGPPPRDDLAARQEAYEAEQERRHVEGRRRRQSEPKIEYRVKPEAEQRQAARRLPISRDRDTGRLEFVNGDGAELRGKFEIEFPKPRWRWVFDNAARYVTTRTTDDELLGLIRQWLRRDAADRAKEPKVKTARLW